MSQDRHSLKFKCTLPNLISAASKLSGVANIAITQPLDVDNIINHLIGVIGSSYVFVTQYVHIRIYAEGSQIDSEEVTVNIVMNMDKAITADTFIIDGRDESIKEFNKIVIKIQNLILSKELEP